MNKLCFALAVSLALILAPAAGMAGNLMSDVPAPPDSRPLGGTKPIHSGGVLTSYTSSASSSTVLETYADTLPKTGWTVAGGGGGGSPWGGGGGLRATKGPKYLVVRAGGPAGLTFVKICVWPAKPADTTCDDD